MLRRPKPFGVLLLAAASACALAQEATLSVDQAVQIGLNQNPQVTAGKAGVESAYHSYKSLGSLPPINLSGSRFYGTLSTADTVLDFNTGLDFSGQRRYAAANANALFTSARYAFRETLLTLEQQIRDAYWSLAAAQGQTKIADVSLQEAQRVHDLTVKQEQAGSAPHGDVIRSSIDVANAKQTLLAAQGAEKSSLIAFNNFLARLPGTPARLDVDMAEASTLPMPEPGSEKDLEAQALGARPLLKAAVDQTRAADYAVKQAEASRLPDIGIDYQRSTVTSQYLWSFSASLPLLDFGSIRHSIAAAKETKKQNEALQEQTRQQILQQVAQAYSDLQIALQSAAEYKRDILDPSVTLLQMAQLGYQQGATGILPIIDAESTIRNARVGYINSLLAVYKAQDEILAATGVLPKTK